jgi:hypothetical protein
MIGDIEATVREIDTTLQQIGLQLAEDAMTPLYEVELARLSDVPPQDERSVRTILLGSRLAVKRARAGVWSEPLLVDSEDARVAMMMLGAAAQAMQQGALAQSTAEAIREICPYCGADE